MYSVKGINHIALYVYDLEKSKDFFVKYMQANSGRLYRNENTGFSSYFLSFQDGSRIEVMHQEKQKENTGAEKQTGYHHVAFSLGSRDAIDTLTKILKDDGYKVISGPRITGDGYYESSVVIFEENIIELTM